MRHFQTGSIQSYRLRTHSDPNVTSVKNFGEKHSVIARNAGSVDGIPAESQSTTAELGPSRRGVSSRDLFFGLVTVALLLLLSGTLRELFNYASDLENKNASQVFLIPFVSGALIFLNRARIFKRVEYGAVPGALVIAGGIALWVASQRWGSQLAEGDRLALETGALIVSWIGCFLVFYGSHAFREALFPLLFLVFSMPIPSVILDPLTALLRRGSADISYLLLKMTGTPVFREGFIYTLPRLRIEIADECSGIRSFISMLILSIVAGNMLLESWWRRIVLVLVAIPIMLFKNALRIATLSLLSIHVDPGIIESRLHREGGIPFFIVALLLIYPVLVMLIRSERRGGSFSLREKMAGKTF